MVFDPSKSAKVSTIKGQQLDRQYKLLCSALPDLLRYHLRETILYIGAILGNIPHFWLVIWKLYWI